MKLSEKTPTTTHRILVYGGPKTGKTELVGRLAEHYNLLWFDIEKGHNTLFKLPKEWQERINVIEIPDTRAVPMASETLKKVFRGGIHKICGEHGKVACMSCMKMGKPTETVDLYSLGADTIVVVDSLTQLTSSIINHVTKGMDDEYKLEFDDYGDLGKHMGNFLSDVQQAPFNVVCISHETTAKLEDGKERIVPVAGTRNFSRNTAKYFDDVVFSEIVNGAHKFGSSTLYRNGIVSGSRSGAALEKMTVPSLMDIMKGIATPINPASPTPGVVAATGLNALRDKLKAAVSAPAVPTTPVTNTLKKEA